MNNKTKIIENFKKKIKTLKKHNEHYFKNDDQKFLTQIMIKLNEFQNLK